MVAARPNDSGLIPRSAAPSWESCENAFAPAPTTALLKAWLKAGFWKVFKKTTL